MQVQASSQLAESIVRHIRTIVTVLEADGVVRFVNDASTAALGHDPATATGRSSLDWVHPDDQGLALERRQWLLGAQGRTTTTVLRVRDAAGVWRHVESHGVNLLDDPQVRGLLYVTRDVEDEARAELALVHALGAQRVVAELGVQALRVSELEDVLREGLQRVAALLAAPSVTLLLSDEDGLAVRLHHAADPLPPGSRWPHERSQAASTLAGRHPTIVGDLTSAAHGPPPQALLSRGLVCALDVPLEGPEGVLGVLGVQMAAPCVFSPVDVQFLQGVANVLAGALLRQQREQRAVDQALHCPLTGLPTRPLFDDRLAHALDRARRGGGEVALLMVDLDRFKHVNDVWGHLAGDEVLRTLGRRLASCARGSDTVARFGGDEFVVLCEDEVTHVGVARVAAAIRRACAQAVPLPGGEEVLLSASVGTSWSVEEGADADALLRSADASMYLDKKYGLRA